MPRARPRKGGLYSNELKLTAFRLGQQPGSQMQTVAARRPSSVLSDVARQQTGAIKSVNVRSEFNSSVGQRMCCIPLEGQVGKLNT